MEEEICEGFCGGVRSSNEPRDENREEIRRVDGERDAGEIAEINRWYVENSTAIFDFEALTEEEMRRKIEGIAKGGYPYYVYVREGRIEGYCYAHAWKEKRAYYPTWETTIYLRQECRGRGIGRRLMERVIDDCRRGGCRSLIACITAENEESCRFHEKLGFERVSLFKEVGMKFGRWLDVADYQLRLLS